MQDILYLGDNVNQYLTDIIGLSPRGGGAVFAMGGGRPRRPRGGGVRPTADAGCGMLRDADQGMLVRLDADAHI